MFFYKIHQKKKCLLTVLTHTSRLFYQRTFYQSDTQRILILILLSCLILRLVFLDVQIQCVFYSFHNKFPCFIICKNYFFFLFSLTIYFLFLCFCFKNLDLQITQFDFSLSTLFVSFTSSGLKLSV